MKKVTKYENKKVLVLGLAKSGVSAAKLLHELGAFVTVNDFKPFEENKEAQSLLELGIRVITGHHPVELLDEDFVLIVKNPGIPYNNPILEKAIEKNLPILTEVELAYEISEAPFIGITGTNGKTTTTTMIGEILKQGRKKGHAYLAGNIGIPASSEAQKVTSNDIIVTELSSFQLLGIDRFKPQIAVITNMYETHIDYHGSREAYVEAKWRIQKNMTAKDYLVLNYNQSEQRELAQMTQATVIPFSTKEVLSNGAYESLGKLYYKEEYIMDSKELGVVGTHNIENALAAIAVAKLLEVENESIKITLTHFTGVEHRTEYVTEVDGRKFYNDSKATNILATEMALSGFDNSKVILLAGGLDRGNDFDELMPAIKGLKGIIVFGETSSKIKAIAEKSKISLIKEVETMEEAVNQSYKLSEVGDAILLSPACASWDQYPNFEIRGTAFKEAVQQLKR